MITPDVFNGMEILKGVDFDQDITLSGVDLTGCTVACQLRRKQALDADLLASFDVLIVSPLTGELNLFLDKEVTKTLEAKIGFYSLVVTNGAGLDSCYLMGSMSITNTATVVV